MKARLNLSVDKQLLDDVKKIAAEKDTTVAGLVTGFFQQLTKPEEPETILEKTQQANSKPQPHRVNHEENYYRDQGHKYGY